MYLPGVADRNLVAHFCAPLFIRCVRIVETLNPDQRWIERQRLGNLVIIGEAAPPAGADCSIRRHCQDLPGGRPTGLTASTSRPNRANVRTTNARAANSCRRPG